MEILVQRTPTEHDATIGTFNVDNGAFECFSLEPTIREQPGVAVMHWKIANVTAIPAGRYRVERKVSGRFHENTPHLVDVPGFSFVEIHIGNFPRDTEGCTLLGMKKGVGAVLQSGIAIEKFYKMFDAAIDRGEQVWIEYRNPFS